MEHAVKLRQGRSGESVEAILDDDLPPSTLAELERQWRELREIGNAKLEREGRGGECEHGHWAWDREHKRLGVRENRFRLLGVRIGTEWQGAMTVYREPEPAQLWSRWRKWGCDLFGIGRRPRVLIIDYVESAPWNFEPFTRPDPPRLRGIGGILIEYAVRISHEMGLRGRIGLFSLSGAESFYSHLGLARLFEDRNPRSPSCGCWYYELSVEVADQFLARRNRVG